MSFSNPDQTTQNLRWETSSDAGMEISWSEADDKQITSSCCTWFISLTHYLWQCSITKQFSAPCRVDWISSPQLIGVVYQSLFHPWNKIADTCNLNEDRVIQAHGFSGFSVGSTLKTTGWKIMMEKSCFIQGSQDVEKRRSQGQKSNLPGQSPVTSHSLIAQ